MGDGARPMRRGPRRPDENCHHCMTLVDSYSPYTKLCPRYRFTDSIFSLECSAAGCRDAGRAVHWANSATAAGIVVDFSCFFTQDWARESLEASSFTTNIKGPQNSQNLSRQAPDVRPWIYQTVRDYDCGLHIHTIRGHYVPLINAGQQNDYPIPGTILAHVIYPISKRSLYNH